MDDINNIEINDNSKENFEKNSEKNEEKKRINNNDNQIFLENKQNKENKGDLNEINLNNENIKEIPNDMRESYNKIEQEEKLNFNIKNNLQNPNDYEDHIQFKNKQDNDENRNKKLLNSISEGKEKDKKDLKINEKVIEVQNKNEPNIQMAQLKENLNSNNENYLNEKIGQIVQKENDISLKERNIVNNDSNLEKEKQDLTLHNNNSNSDLKKDIPKIIYEDEEENQKIFEEMKYLKKKRREE